MTKEREAEIRDHGVDHLECAYAIEEIFRELDATRERVAKALQILAHDGTPLSALSKDALRERIARTISALGDPCDCYKESK